MLKTPLAVTEAPCIGRVVDASVTVPFMMPVAGGGTGSRAMFWVVVFSATITTSFTVWVMYPVFSAVTLYVPASSVIS